MSYDEFFTDGDKPYSENLNDALALLNAFDITVPMKIPEMFNNSEFGGNIGVTRKAGIGLVTLQSFDEGITINPTEINGTGEIVLRIYPNFNSFYKWKKLILEKTGDVTISFRKTDGSAIGATVNNEGYISENAALKSLQEIDVVFTLNSASISSILISFINNQLSHTRVSALLEASQLTNVNGTVSEGDTNAVNGDTVNNALTSLSNVINDELDEKEDLVNKIDTLNNSTTNYPSCKAVKTVIDTKTDVGHTHLSRDITDLFNMVYPVGAIYMSVNNTNPSLLFGGTWEKIEDTFLLASGTAYSNGDTGGSADAVVVNHNHTQKSHNHTQNAHNHSPNSNSFLQSNVDISINGTARAVTSEGGSKWHYLYVSSGNYKSSSTVNMSGTTANKTATNNGTVAENNATGVDGTGKNMPPYLAVNMWKRIA